VTPVLHWIFPLVHPTPFLGVVGLCFASSAVATAGATLGVRLTFRRGKGLEEL
jgi:hypothetical protein